MPELNRKRWELFCRHVAEGSPVPEAYELAGFSPAPGNAYTFSKKPEIAGRIEEIKEQKLVREIEVRKRMEAAGLDPDDPKLAQAEVKEWTVAMVQAELYRNAQLAQVAQEFTSANKSLEMIGKTIGLFLPEKNANDKPKKPEVSIAFINQTLQDSEDGSGAVPAGGTNPLQPRLPDTRKPRK